LSDSKARAFTFGERTWLTLGSRPVAAKTGTTNDYRDAWTIGYTPSIVTGVWVGNNDNSEMKRGAAGGEVAAPIWHDFMKRILGDTPVEQFRKPEIKKTGKPVLDGEMAINSIIKIDKATGKLATDHTPESFIEEIKFTQNHSILYYVDKDDPLGKEPKNPDKDPQFELWEERVLSWAAATSTSTIEPPTEYDNVHLPENIPTFEILSPRSNETITQAFLVARVKASAPRGINHVEYYIDDSLVFSNYSYPFSLEKQINFLSNGFHNLKIKVCDDVDNCAEQSIEFNLILDNEPQSSDIDASLIEPANGLAVNRIDFPLTIKFSVTNPEQIAKINVLLKPQDSDSPKIVAIAQPVESTTVSTTWKQLSDSGTYDLYAEAHGWNNQFKKTNSISITINNQ